MCLPAGPAGRRPGGDTATNAIARIRTTLLSLAVSATGLGVTTMVGPHHAALAATCTPAFADSSVDGASGVAGVQADYLDITRGDLGLTADEASMRAVLTIRDLTVTVPTGASATNYIVYWTRGGATYGTDAEVTANVNGVASVTYSAGRVTFTDSAGTRSVHFTPTASATGSITPGANGTVEVDAWRGSFGLSLGDRLTSIGAVTARGAHDNATVSDQDGAPDAASTDYIVGQATCISPQTAPDWLVTAPGTHAGAVTVDTALRLTIATGWVDTSGGYPQPRHDVFTMTAYNSTTGSQAWAVRYDEPTTSGFGPAEPVLSADGASVYVAGRGAPGAAMIRAYDASSGALRWAVQLAAPAGSTFVTQTDGTTPQVHLASAASSVVATGAVQTTAGTASWLTAALRSADGSRAWVAALPGTQGNDRQVPAGIQASADGQRVLVGGLSDPTAAVAEPTVAIYRVADGRRLALVQQPLATTLVSVSPTGFGVSADGSTAVVTVDGRPANGVGTTMAITVYDLASNTARWSREQAIGGVIKDLVSADGGSVYVVTTQSGGPSNTGRVTAYDRTGAVRWAADDTRGANYSDAALNDEGTRLLAVGGQSNFGRGPNDATLEIYDTATGTTTNTVTYNTRPDGTAPCGMTSADWKGAVIAVTGDYNLVMTTSRYSLGS